MSKEPQVHSLMALLTTVYNMRKLNGTTSLLDFKVHANRTEACNYAEEHLHDFMKPYPDFTVAYFAVPLKCAKAWVVMVIVKHKPEVYSLTHVDIASLQRKLKAAHGFVIV